jgi:hypothetical protein
MQPPFPFPPHLPKRIGCALRCVRDLFAEQARRPPQILATVNDQYVLDLANGFSWRLECRASVAPRLYLQLPAQVFSFARDTIFSMT